MKLGKNMHTLMIMVVVNSCFGKTIEILKKKNFSTTFKLEIFQNILEIVTDTPAQGKEIQQLIDEEYLTIKDKGELSEFITIFNDEFRFFEKDNKEKIKWKQEKE